MSTQLPDEDLTDLADSSLSKSVIVVDDEVGVRELLTLWLQSGGMR
jgi:hypothetical protein